LGGGGAGRVERVLDLDRGAELAVKTLRLTPAASSASERSFDRQRAIVLGVTGEHVVRVLDVFRGEASLNIAMEFFPDGSLRHWPSNHASPEALDCVDLMRQMLLGLIPIHRAGIVHRDVRPENLFLKAVGDAMQLKVSDFSVCALLDSLDLRAMASWIGVAPYKAPELSAGHSVSPAADLYSVGVVAYELLTGRLPFDQSGGPQAVRWQQENVKPARPNELDGPLWTMLQTLLAADPADRPSDADAARSMMVDLGLWTSQSSPDLAVADPVVPDPLVPAASMFVKQPKVPAQAATSGVEGVETSIPQPDRVEPGVEAAAPLPLLHQPPMAPTSAAEGNAANFTASSKKRVAPIPDLISVGKRRRQSSRPEKKSLIIGSAVFLVLAAGGAATPLILDSSSSNRPESVSLPFASEHYAGLDVSRTWILSDKKLHGELLVVTTRDGDQSFDEVLPKELLSDVSDATFDPPPASIIRKDPIVRFEVHATKGTQKIFTYDIAVPSGPTTSDRLAAWAADQRRDVSAYERATHTPAPVTLKTLSVTPPALRLQVGGAPHRLSVSGTMSDGSSASSSILDKVVWTSSRSDIAAVGKDGTLTPRAAGSATVRAILGGVRAEASVEVSPPAPSENQTHSSSAPGGNTPPTKDRPTFGSRSTPSTPSHVAPSAPPPGQVVTSVPPVVDPTTEPPVVDPTTEPPVVDPTTEPPVVDPTTEPPVVDPTTEPPIADPPPVELSTSP
jgi:serine/threonine protein kinase